MANLSAAEMDEFINKLIKAFKASGNIPFTNKTTKIDSKDESDRRKTVQQRTILDKLENYEKEQFIKNYKNHVKDFNNSFKKGNASIEDKIKMTSKLFETFADQATPEQIIDAQKRLSSAFKKLNVKNIVEYQSKLEKINLKRLQHEKNISNFSKQIEKLQAEREIFEKHGDVSSVQNIDKEIDSYNKKIDQSRNKFDMLSNILDDNNKNLVSNLKLETKKTTIIDSVNSSLSGLKDRFFDMDIQLGIFTQAVGRGMMQFREGIKNAAIEDVTAGFFDRQIGSIMSGVSVATRDAITKQNRFVVNQAGSVDKFNNIVDESLPIFERLTGSPEEAIKLQGMLMNSFQNSGISVVKNSKLMKHMGNTFKDLQTKISMTDDQMAESLDVLLSDQKIRTDLNSLSEEERVLYTKDAFQKQALMQEQGYTLDEIRQLRQKGSDVATMTTVSRFQKSAQLSALAGTVAGKDPRLAAAMANMARLTKLGRKANAAEVGAAKNEMQAAFDAFAKSRPDLSLDVANIETALESFNLQEVMELPDIHSALKDQNQLAKGTITTIEEGNSFLSKINHYLSLIQNATTNPLVQGIGSMASVAVSAGSTLLTASTSLIMIDMLKNISKSVDPTDILTKSNYLTNITKGLQIVSFAMKTSLVGMAAGVGYLLGSYLYDKFYENIQASMDYWLGSAENPQEMGVLERLSNTVGGWIFDVVESVNTSLTDSKNLVTQKVTYFTSMITTFFDNVIQSIHTSISDNIQFVKTLWESVTNWISNKITEFTSPITSFFNDITSFATNISSLSFSDIFNKIKDYVTNFSVTDLILGKDQTSQTTTPNNTKEESGFFGKITSFWSSDAPAAMAKSIDPLLKASTDQNSQINSTLNKTYDSLMENQKTNLVDQTKTQNILKENNKKLDESVNNNTSVLEEFSAMVKQYVTITSDEDRQRFAAKYKQDDQVARMYAMRNNPATPK